jgi:hypothetical protein
MSIVRCDSRLIIHYENTGLITSAFFEGKNMPEKPQAEPLLIDPAKGPTTVNFDISGLYFETTRATVLADVERALGEELYGLFNWRVDQAGGKRLAVGSLRAPIGNGKYSQATTALRAKLPADEARSLKEITLTRPSEQHAREAGFMDHGGRGVRDEGVGAPKQPVAALAADWYWPMVERLLPSAYETPRKVIRIAHLDTGISRHPCLVDGFVDGKSFYDGGGNGVISWPDDGPLKYLVDHGTATASLIAGSHGPGSSLRMSGMALLQPPTGMEAERGPAVVVPCQVSSSVALFQADVDRVAAAINWAVDNDCKVITISLGSEGLKDSNLEKAVRRAYDNGVILCAASGQIVPFMLWPASFALKTYGELCICCGPSTPEKTPWKLANWWSWADDYVTIAAPANHMPKATWQSGAPATYAPEKAILTQSEGSSYSTAYTAAAAALWYSKYWNDLQKVKKSEIVGLFRSLLVKTCDPWAERGLNIGPGILNPARLLRQPLSGNFKTDELLIVDMRHMKCMVAGDSYDQHVYHQASEGRQNARWILEPVLKDGQPVFHIEAGKSHKVFYIRDMKHNKYVVAGDIADSNVYHQPHEGRTNAQWTLEQCSTWTSAMPSNPFNRTPKTETYPVYHIRDMKHRLCLVAGDQADSHIYHQPHNNRRNAEWVVDSRITYKGQPV